MLSTSLVVGRKNQEAVFIGDDIRVQVVAIHNGVVRLRITAPPEIQIEREEVRDAIRRDNRAAAEVVEASR